MLPKRGIFKRISMIAEVKKLDDSQLESFDWEFIDAPKKMAIQKQIDREFPDGCFSFLDIGGGNGSFTDWLLATYPRAKGAVLDNSELLLNKNSKHPNKEVILGSATELQQLRKGSFDIVFLNYLLHHLVFDGYEQSRSKQAECLRYASGLLTDRGRISVFENIYDGWLINGLPSVLIFYLTSLKRVAPMIRKMGANTAGVGVCFLSKKQWQATFNRLGLVVRSYTDHREFDIALYKKVLLHLGRIRGGHFWCSVNHSQTE